MAFIPRPALRNGVDLQLRNAFAEGNWVLVARLAERRAKMTDDPSYYEAVRLCGVSQLDSPQEKFAGHAAIDELVRKGTVVKDLDTLELYEWILETSPIHSDLSQTVGPLRVRMVKADPKNKSKATRCLQACIRSWDLANAQQIAAALDKTFPQGRLYFFWNVLITFMLSTRSDVPEQRRAIFAQLALRQLEKAADLREKAGDSDEIPERALQKEEEILLYYRILQRHGTRDSLISRLQSPVFGALKQLSEGRKTAFLVAVGVLEEAEDWDALYTLCRDALGKGPERDSVHLLASDWAVWKALISSASKHDAPKEAFSKAVGLITKYLSALKSSRNIYTAVVTQATIESTFALPGAMVDQDSAATESPRVGQIRIYIERNVARPSCFDDVKDYVERLSVVEIKQLLLLLQTTGSLTGPYADAFQVLGIKIRYLLTTCPQTLTVAAAATGSSSRASAVCQVCGENAARQCHGCLLKIASDALALQAVIESGGRELEHVERVDSASDLAIVAALALLKMSGLRQEKDNEDASPLHRIDIKRFLQAVLLLDIQQGKSLENAPLKLLLVQLYLLLGCAQQANQLWNSMDVKRAIMDSLGALYFDRISSVAPGLFRTPLGGRPLMEQPKNYFFKTLRNGSPIRVWDAFEAGNHCSVLDIAEFWDRLRRSSALIMTLIEERRGLRAVTGKNDGAVDDDVDLFGWITDDTVFCDSTDYGCLPKLDSSFCPPILSQLRIGPGLSNTRSHLQLLGEQFVDLLSFTSPREYRPSKGVDVHAKERAYVLETLDRINNSVTNFLQLRDTSSHLTPAEEAYYTIVSLLSAFLPTCLQLNRGGSVPSTVGLLVGSITESVRSLQDSFLATTTTQPDANGDNTPRASGASTLLAFTSLNTMATLRDTALVLRQSVAFLSVANDRDRERDKAHGGLPKTVAQDLKVLDALATAALRAVKDRVGFLRSSLDEAGWMDRISELTLGDMGGDDDEHDDEISRRVMALPNGGAVVEEWSGRLLEGWRDTAKGWAIVKME